MIDKSERYFGDYSYAGIEPKAYWVTDLYEQLVNNSYHILANVKYFDKLNHYGLED